MTSKNNKLTFKKSFAILILVFTKNFNVLAQTTQNINVLFVNEVGNDLAQVAVDVALNYIRKNPSLGLSVELLSVEGNRTDSKGLLESLCSKYSEALNTNRMPHVILDTTLTDYATY
ncbi:ionotropic receptor 25a isoform X7 [Culex quinquefasciatus]|uniref:ionotropic receptor 25a isoform X7 n=1 Tax=Culex quinquefasciatus TaxID=7176 RepID=UPI0018E3F4B6|nr:ionotropic receptor 25a isoform X7 [Culex quinquefasciatus]